MSNKVLAEISRRFFAQKHVFRYKMKKVADMSEAEVTQNCHAFCEENSLIPEWKKFRENIESEYVYCEYLQEFIFDSDCYDMQMIACGYIKKDALPQFQIDREKLISCCVECGNKL